LRLVCWEVRQQRPVIEIAEAQGKCCVEQRLACVAEESWLHHAFSFVCRGALFALSLPAGGCGPEGTNASTKLALSRASNAPPSRPAHTTRTLSRGTRALRCGSLSPARRSSTHLFPKR